MPDLYAGRINRIRQFYFDAAPQVARYLPPPEAVSPWEIARQAGLSSPFWFQFLTIAGALAVVDSVTGLQLSEVFRTSDFNIKRLPSDAALVRSSPQADQSTRLTR